MQQGSVQSTRLLEFVPGQYKTQKMCERAVEDDPGTIEFVTDHLKTKKMCERAVEDDPYNLEYVPDWFVT